MIEEQRQQFLDRCEFLRLDVTEISLALTISAPLNNLEARWYESLDLDAPDYGIYMTDTMLADLWVCWQTYSRRYLQCVRKLGLDPRRIVDVGCGLGYSSGSLKMMFPRAEVFATNMPKTPHWTFAHHMSEEFDFKLLPLEEIGTADLVFASEYFEHHQEPLQHLDDVLELQPEALVIANTFTQRSLGHFNRYIVGEHLLDGRKTSREFNDGLRIRGYTKIPTLFWNDRPTFWRKPRTSWSER
jgi:2-polyprenyl-3-methyl-5-hydroxy-6-metoxy-1,4-benzoquinol methylase